MVRFEDQLFSFLFGTLNWMPLVASVFALIVMLIFSVRSQRLQARVLMIGSICLFAIPFTLPNFVLQFLVGCNRLAAPDPSVPALNILLLVVLICILAAPTILAFTLESTPAERKNVYLWNLATIFGGVPWAVALFLSLRGMDSGKARTSVPK